MALLQIAEPGQATAPHQHRLVVGIDLGTTNSLVASVMQGSPSVMPDAEGHSLVPSVVHFAADGSFTVGRDAQRFGDDDPLNTIASAKRLMGREVKDLKGHDIPYHLEALQGSVAIRTASGLKTPPEIGAEILKLLRQRAEETLGGTLTGAVITVPAYFDDAQRQATKDAARMAGLPVLRLLNEPTAAAIAYGLDTGERGRFVVYDLGGGTFDVSLLNLQQGVFEVMATGGDAALGGDDFDRRLSEWFVSQTPAAHWEARDMANLHAAARRAKEALTHADSVVMACTDSDLQNHRVAISRAQFELLCRDLMQKTLSITRKVIRDAGLGMDDIAGIVLVGGSTRMPMVHQGIAQVFGRAPLRGIDQDQAVALGAAIQADQLAGNQQGNDDSLLLLDVCPLSLGLETMGGLVEKIIPRNSTLPLARAQDFTTFKDGQTALSLHVVQGEREVVDQCRSLARFTLRGIPPMTAGAARIRVTFQIDTDGLMSVTAVEQISGVSAHIEVKPAYGLSHESITDMLRQSMGHAEDDATTRGIREAEVDARRLLDATEAAIKEDGAALLTTAELAEIRSAMLAVYELLEQIAQGGEGTEVEDKRTLRTQIRNVTQKLNEVTTPFAGRRMDQRVRQALGGKVLDQVV